MIPRPNESHEEKIQRIKDRIADARDFLSSDFCTQCTYVLEEIKELEKTLNELMNNE